MADPIVFRDTIEWSGENPGISDPLAVVIVLCGGRDDPA